jgi:hypothetical protein
MSKIPFILCQDWQPALILNNCTSKDTFEIYLLEWEIPLDNESWLIMLSEFLEN